MLVPKVLNVLDQEVMVVDLVIALVLAITVAILPLVLIVVVSLVFAMLPNIVPVLIMIVRPIPTPLTLLSVQLARPVPLAGEPVQSRLPVINVPVLVLAAVQVTPMAVLLTLLPAKSVTVVPGLTPLAQFIAI